ncbi:MAG: AmmeMemoRadiSam system protein B [Dehalococcoidales bacterium]|nr:AmmeMemoRadiSam system protein B [Dehalococcoidales bacterium]
MVRHPVVAGQFYPAQASRLSRIISGMVDDQAEKEDVIGVVSPHAGYPYSGPVAAAAISRIKFKDTFVILGPNHTGMGKALSIMTVGSWETPLGSIEIDTELAGQILTDSRYLEEDDKSHQYEHSIEVQIPFLQYFSKDFRIVPVAFSYHSPAAYKDVGRAIARAVKDTEKGVVIIASSDMTHYEPQESARQKDNKAIEAILDLDEDELLRRVDEFGISMCGYAPTVALITAAKALGATRAELVRYQTSGDVTGDYSSVVGYAAITIKGMSPLAKLAKMAVETYVRDGETLKPEELTAEMKERAGVFVSIHKLGNLRGCIGTFEPDTENVAEETIVNAVSSATRDPRFSPISPGELKDLDYNVDVLTTPEPVEGKDQLNPKEYGVIVESGLRRGLLLPDLEGVDSVDYQISICRQKAGILPDEPVKLYRFRVKRYK